MQTVLPASRKAEGVPYKRERIETDDNDFLDLDWVNQKSDQLVILTHGLEGNSDRPYIKEVVKHFTEKGWDALAWNCRSCSGEINRQLRLYNHGEIGDIDTVVRHAIEKYGYKTVVLVGFSMGGNISLKYAAVKSYQGTLPKAVKKVIAFSSPLQMASSTAHLGEPSNWLYKHTFIKRLKKKAYLKALTHPDKIDLVKLQGLKRWEDYIRFFAKDINGYQDENDFFEHGSAGKYIHLLKIPSLIIQAQNDPMLTPDCFPYALASTNENIFLETPKTGGHCGFTTRGNLQSSWAGERAYQFASQ